MGLSTVAVSVRDKPQKESGPHYVRDQGQGGGGTKTPPPCVLWGPSASRVIGNRGDAIRVHAEPDPAYGGGPGRSARLAGLRAARWVCICTRISVKPSITF